MKLNTMPKELACELLVYISEREDFDKVCESLGGEFPPERIKALLRELAAVLQAELKDEKRKNYNVKECSYLSKGSKKVISCLSPGEERTLLRVFGLVDEK